MKKIEINDWAETHLPVLLYFAPPPRARLSVTQWRTRERAQHAFPCVLPVIPCVPYVSLFPHVSLCFHVGAMVVSISYIAQAILTKHHALNYKMRERRGREMQRVSFELLIVLHFLLV